MSRTERIEAARRKVCPRCHAEAGKKCQGPGRLVQSGASMVSVPGKIMKGVHAERLALVESAEKP